MEVKENQLGGNGEFGALSPNNLELSEIFPRKIRKKRICYYLIWLAINVLLIAYIVILLGIFNGSWKLDCVHRLMVWLSVYNLIASLQLIRTFAIILVWHKAKDPAQVQLKIELFYGVWLFLAEASLIIYGNTFIYDEEIKDCNEAFRFKWGNQDLDTNMLRATALVLIIYGYFLLLGMILIILFYIAAFMGYRSYVK